MTGAIGGTIEPDPADPRLADPGVKPMRVSVLSALLLRAAASSGLAGEDLRIFSAAAMKAPLLAGQGMATAATGSGMLLDSSGPPASHMS
jgi:hypothetical protein